MKERNQLIVKSTNKIIYTYNTKILSVAQSAFYGVLGSVRSELSFSLDPFSYYWKVYKKDT